jgi:hypothetical protein
MEKISSENGIEGTRARLQSLDPQATDVPAYNRLLGKRGQLYPGDATPSQGTLGTLVDHHNTMIDELAALTARIDALPFPLSSS